MLTDLYSFWSVLGEGPFPCLSSFEASCIPWLMSTPFSYLQGHQQQVESFRVAYFSRCCLFSNLIYNIFNAWIFLHQHSHMHCLYQVLTHMHTLQKESIETTDMCVSGESNHRTVLPEGATFRKKHSNAAGQKAGAPLLAGLVWRTSRSQSS